MNAFNTNNVRPGGLPTTIPDYLEHLRRSLAGADPALVQDALYDAEEYLRSELAENPGRSEADVIVAVAGSYGVRWSAPTPPWSRTRSTTRRNTCVRNSRKTRGNPKPKSLPLSLAAMARRTKSPTSIATPK